MFDLKIIVESFEIGDPIKSLFHPVFYVNFANAGVISISLSIRVPDALEAGKKIQVTMGKNFPRYYRDSEEYTINFLRDFLHEMLKHEADESISVNGDRIFDPHRGL